MLRQKENKINYFGSAVFAFLFFLLIYAFSGNLGKHAAIESPYKFASELESNATAVIVEVQEVHFFNILIPLVDKSNFKLFGGEMNVVADNNFMQQRIVFLQAAVLRIKPVFLHLFYRQFHSIDTDDLPHLS